VCGRLAVRICPDCLRSLSGLFFRFCVECGREAPCAAHPGGLICRSVSAYGGVNRDVVHAMKYDGGKSIASMMGELMAETLPRPDADFLVPVPLHRASARDYNQAALIAGGASRVWKIPVENCLRWAAGSRNQAFKSGRGERELPDDAMKSSDKIRGRRVLLVDDVCTTGNTLLAARRALSGARAEIAGAMVWSRKV
jgi:predicted amidophosphoribosyltransferase